MHTCVHICARVRVPIYMGVRALLTSDLVYGDGGREHSVKRFFIRLKKFETPAEAKERMKAQHSLVCRLDLQ
jgi:hypothetical protein